MSKEPRQIILITPEGKEKKLPVDCYNRVPLEFANGDKDYVEQRIGVLSGLYGDTFREISYDSGTGRIMGVLSGWVLGDKRSATVAPRGSRNLKMYNR
jgi:hypothetical protein